ncbi:MAG: DUF1284 domain-containing protein [Blautia sp.]|nr:DUF1284 domain-containing protein [Blautia sp.]
MLLCESRNRRIPLRPHHGMCLAYFKGKGYSDSFSAHMAEMLGIFEKGAEIILQVQTDEICSACPNNREKLCADFGKVEKYDRAVLSLCGFEEGQEMTFDAFVKAVENRVLSAGKRVQICGDCQWNTICENQESRWK